MRYRLAGGLAGAGVETGGVAWLGGVAIGPVAPDPVPVMPDPVPVAPDPVVVRGAGLVAVGELVFDAVSVVEPPQ